MAVSPPFLLATKCEAFAGRGREDYMGSRDFADVVSLLDGRAELVAEVQASPSDLRAYLAGELFVIRPIRDFSMESMRGCSQTMRARLVRS